MPCQSDYLEANSREIESRRVIGFMKEAGLDYKAGGPIDNYYGRVDTLDEDTAALCAWCKKASANKIKKMTLEFQIWWRDHQKADAARNSAMRKLNRENKPAHKNRTVIKALRSFKTVIETRDFSKSKVKQTIRDIDKAIDALSK